MVWLWSDVLIWLLVVAVVGWWRQVGRDARLWQQWQQVFASASALASAIVLALFVLIALADSLHWRTDDPYRPVVSLLDVSLGKMARAQEKTYSAPFAREGMWYETHGLEDGRVVRAPVALAHGGAHLGSDQSLLTDVVLRSLIWLGLGAVLGLMLVKLHAWWLSRQSGNGFALLWHGIWRGRTVIPWRVGYVTVIVLLALLLWLWGMGQVYHVLGTGKVGQDVLYETFKGVRTGFLIGALTTVIALPFALVLGVMAGYFRGWVDDGVQYVYTTLNAVPGVLLIASAILLAQVYLSQHADAFASEQERADVRLLLVCLVLGLTGWTGLARLLRAETMKLRELEFVRAARVLGLSHTQVLRRHVVPNLWHLVLIALVLDFSGLVLAEAVLSYVGIGVDPTMPSWGNMINLARQELNREPVVWWNLAGAFAGMFLLVLSANLLADRIQQVFNPRAAGK